MKVRRVDVIDGTGRFESVWADSRWRLEPGYLVVDKNERQHRVVAVYKQVMDLDVIPIDWSVGGLSG